ncbi:hypothetical protein KR018_006528 [Drosophila ironensis]|nr:hypothetical protein KR018_006528 [Drosophila ironensis]
MTMSSTLTATEVTEEASNETEAVGEMFSDADMAEVRHVVQRILVPCVFVIGLLGNSVSIYVLTRKRMRCTTNIYLTALAITDIAYLTFQQILSLQHYDYVKYHCEIYWQLYGYFVWLCDSSAYISIYIAVCFTIERFIAIRYPLKRQTFCTESLAKKVIAAVALFCLLSTLSTAFEHSFNYGWRLIDDAYRPCNQTLANVSPLPQAPAPPAAPTRPLPTSQLPTPATVWQDSQDTATTARSPTLPVFDWGSGGGSGAGSGDGGEPENIPRQRRDWQTSGFVTTPTLRKALEQQDADQVQVTESLHHLSRGLKSFQDPNATEAFAFNVTDYCQNTTYFLHVPSELGNNDLYANVWSLFTLLVFVLLPLLLLATFNSFLILLVHRSKSLRGDLTNANSIRRTKRKSHSGLTGSVSQENRVTITLIAVVLLFIVCQLPWAIYLILDQYMQIPPSTQVVAGNVCNLLAAFNAASNFFLYCVLSDKYRKTVRELITGYRYRRRHARNNTSLYVPHTTTTLTHINGDRGGGGSYYGGAGSRRSRTKAAAAGRLIA